MVANRGNLQNLQKSDVVKNEGSNMSFIEENREKKGILERVLFACSDWFSDLSKSAEQSVQRTKSIEDVIKAVSVTIDNMNEDNDHFVDQRLSFKVINPKFELSL